MLTPFILMILSSAALPALAVFALFLRRNFFKGKLKLVFLVAGLGLLSFAVYDTFLEQGEDFGQKEALIGLLTAFVTIFILSRFNHKHETGAEGVKGIVISETFHSLIDGAVIGATYLINPVLGYATTIGIIVHELPKIIGTLALFRSLGLSIRKTMFYGFLAQIGSPVAAVLIYTLGKKINHEDFHSLEIASVSSLAAIVLWIIYLEIRFHTKHNKRACSGHTHNH